MRSEAGDSFSSPALNELDSVSKILLGTCLSLFCGSGLEKDGGFGIGFV